MTFFERVEALCVENGVSPDKLCKDLGLSNATATKWRKGAEPRNATKRAVADYFNVSIEYISGETDEKNTPRENPEGLDEIDAEIIKVPHNARAYRLPASWRSR